MNFETIKPSDEVGNPLDNREGLNRPDGIREEKFEDEPEQKLINKSESIEKGELTRALREKLRLGGLASSIKNLMSVLTERETHHFSPLLDMNAISHLTSVL